MAFRYNEDVICDQLKDHCNSTTKEHYADEIEYVEYVASLDKDVKFMLRSAGKYLHRYGRKDGRNETDLFKAMHFLAMAIHYERLFKEREAEQWYDEHFADYLSDEDRMDIEDSEYDPNEGSYDEPLPTIKGQLQFDINEILNNIKSNEETKPE